MPRFMIIKLGQSTGANSLMRISQSHPTYERAKEYGKVFIEIGNLFGRSTCDKCFRICVNKSMVLKIPKINSFNIKHLFSCIKMVLFGKVLKEWLLINCLNN